MLGPFLLMTLAASITGVRGLAHWAKLPPRTEPPQWRFLAACIGVATLSLGGLHAMASISGHETGGAPGLSTSLGLILVAWGVGCAPRCVTTTAHASIVLTAVTGVGIHLAGFAVAIVRAALEGRWWVSGYFVPRIGFLTILCTMLGIAMAQRLIALHAEEGA